MVDFLRLQTLGADQRDQSLDHIPLINCAGFVNKEMRSLRLSCNSIQVFIHTSSENSIPSHNNKCLVTCSCFPNIYFWSEAIFHKSSCFYLLLCRNKPSHVLYVWFSFYCLHDMFIFAKSSDFQILLVGSHEGQVSLVSMTIDQFGRQRKSLKQFFLSSQVIQSEFLSFFCNA